MEERRRRKIVLGRGLKPLPIISAGHSLKGFAGFLRSVAIADGAVASVTGQSDHAVGKALGWVKYKEENGETVVQPDSRIRRIRSGETGELKVLSIDELIRRFPSLEAALCPLLWELVNTVPSRQWVPSFDYIGGAAFWLTHRKNLFAPSRDHAFELDGLPPNRLARLVLLASFDSVAVLWTHLRLQVLPERRFHIARHLPPALALLSRRPGAERVAWLLFARVRQTDLDDVSWNGMHLSLDAYHLEERAISVDGWVPGPLPNEEPEHHHRNSVDLPDIPVSARAWLEESLPSLRSCPNDTGVKWIGNCRPSRALADPGMPVLLGKGLSLLQQTLGDYW